ncbi:hypothetical protein KSS87_005320 [Heliosperma pusillum]|nr:hypothetical protein KSS87_005320 [Heliosperma pusillum]
MAMSSIITSSGEDAEEEADDDIMFILSKLCYAFVKLPVSVQMQIFGPSQEAYTTLELGKTLEMPEYRLQEETRLEIIDKAKLNGQA